MLVQKEVLPRQKLLWVQVLRGLAAFMVLIFHASQNNVHYFDIRPLFAGFYDYGWLGVEFFFVLSGFIITYIHLQDLETGKNMGRFLAKRFTRIYPIYWVIATVMLGYYLFIKKEDAGITVRIASPGDLVYLARCFLLLPTGTARHNFIESAWTLNYEIWFYLVFAISIGLGFRKAVWLFFGWAFLILFKYYTKIGDSSPILNFMLHSLILYFLMGCVVAWLLKSRKMEMGTGRFLAAFLVVLALFLLYGKISGSVLAETRRDVNYNYLSILALALLLWWAASLDQGKKTAPAPPRILLLVGDASYSIYLSHAPVIMLLYKTIVFLEKKYHPGITPLVGNLLFLLVVATCLVAGILVHLFVEKPLLAFLNRGRQPIRPFTIETYR